MTLMLIFGAVAALYLAMLLMRFAIFALPISAGLIAASLLHDHGMSWAGAAAGGLFAGVLLYGAGRRLVTSNLALLIRFPVLLLFSSAAACAGYQAGSALAAIVGFGPDWQHGFAILAAIVIAAASWRDLASPARLAGGAHGSAQGEMEVRSSKLRP